jgi:hypothetical protein
MRDHGKRIIIRLIYDDYLPLPFLTKLPTAEAPLASIVQTQHDGTDAVVLGWMSETILPLIWGLALEFFDCWGIPSTVLD